VESKQKADFEDEVAEKEEERNQMPKFVVHNGDFLKEEDETGELLENWNKDADFVLANSTCFENELLMELAKKCSELKKGTWMLTLTKKLPSCESGWIEGKPAEWECVLSVKKAMSWGLATVHLQRKIN
jgi:hypothetical protein